MKCDCAECVPVDRSAERCSEFDLEVSCDCWVRSGAEFNAFCAWNVIQFNFRPVADCGIGLITWLNFYHLRNLAGS